MESAQKMNKFMREEVKKSPEMDFRDVMGRYSMDVIASAAFGVDSQNFYDKNSQFTVMGLRVQNMFSTYFGLFKVMLGVLMPSVYALFSFSLLDQTAFDFFKDVVQKTIKQREETSQNRNDILQLLMERRDISKDEEDFGGTSQQKASKIKLSDELIVAQCNQFFLAAFDTVETLLIHAAYELALNPDMQDKLAEELQNAGELTYENVHELEYLDMVISGKCVHCVE
jgi:cytochrome P450